MKTEDIEISLKLSIEELHEIANIMIQQMIWEARMNGSYSFKGLELVEEIFDTIYENPPKVKEAIEYQIEQWYENSCPEEDEDCKIKNSSYIDIEEIYDWDMSKIFSLVEEKK